jgi:hypothetical protein
MTVSMIYFEPKYLHTNLLCINFLYSDVVKDEDPPYVTLINGLPPKQGIQLQDMVASVRNIKLP